MTSTERQRLNPVPRKRLSVNELEPTYDIGTQTYNPELEWSLSRHVN